MRKTSVVNITADAPAAPTPSASQPTLSSVPRSWAAGVTKLDADRTLIVSRGIGHERGEAPRLSVEKRLGSDREVIGEIDDGCVEAGRCISCGTCTGCDNCFVYCPEPAVTRADGVYVFDLDYCKGCGLCAHECPTGFIQMLPEAGSDAV